MSVASPIRRAVLSVTDKTGLTRLGAALVERDVELIASGGTLEHLRQAKLEATPVESVTQFPEMLDGRVKTLHPALHAGLLADRARASHLRDLERHGLPTIDLVVVNFYAFEEATRSDALPVEAIDIGGPTLVRAAAKNHAWVTVLSHPSDYDEFLEALRSDRVDDAFRRKMAARAFARVAEYDRIIAAQFLATTGQATSPGAGGPAHASATRHRLAELRYGENPHQSAEAFVEEPIHGLGAMQQIAGPELSYNNLVDADAACDLAFELGRRPACVIMKHNNPCGAARGATPAAAFEAALACDPVSAYGGVVAFNFPIDAEAAEAMQPHFLEVLCAPEIAPIARERLTRKKRLRMLTVPTASWNPAHSARVERQLHGLILLQERDVGFPELQNLKFVTERQPTASELEDVAFLLAVCKHVRSNAIVVGRNLRTLGIGAGQMSRVDSCEIAVRKAAVAGHDLQSSVAVSDAFFPFPDGVEILARAGVQVILQPGGSKRDDQVIETADRLGLCMILSNTRHFRH